MRDTKLVLLEGIPGSGKSTTAHALQRQLAAMGTPHRWWYEGERGHPLYTFDDAASLNQTVADVFSGDPERVQRVVGATLERWRALAAALETAREVLLFDGMLYGHLGWTLFAGDVPAHTIAAYVAEAEEIAASVGMCLVLLRPDDVGAAVRRIISRRGERWGDDFVRRVTNFPYCRRRDLEGFDGLVRFWQDYRDLCDELCAHSPLAKRRIANDAGDWPAYLREVRALLGLPDVEEPAWRTDPSALGRFAGTYAFTHAGETRTCEVTLEAGALFVTGVPTIWRHTRLIPTAPVEPAGDSGTRFAAESFPFTFTFLADDTAAIREMRLDGPAFAWTTVPTRYVRGQEAGAGSATQGGSPAAAAAAVSSAAS